MFKVAKAWCPVCSLTTSASRDRIPKPPRLSRTGWKGHSGTPWWHWGKSSAQEQQPWTSWATLCCGNFCLAWKPPTAACPLKIRSPPQAICLSCRESSLLTKCVGSLCTPHSGRAAEHHFSLQIFLQNHKQNIVFQWTSAAKKSKLKDFFLKLPQCLNSLKLVQRVDTAGSVIQGRLFEPVFQKFWLWRIAVILGNFLVTSAHLWRWLRLQEYTSTKNLGWNLHWPSMWSPTPMMLCPCGSMWLPWLEGGSGRM